MVIIFEAHTFNGVDNISDDMKSMYIQTINAVYLQIAASLDLSLLKQIIVPENYKDGLYDFQRSVGQQTFMTENDYGIGMAQVVSEKNDDINKEVTIIISKELILALLPDEQYRSVLGTMNSDTGESLRYARILAYNTLHHEFGHVHQRKLAQNMEWIKPFDIPSIILHDQYVSLGLIIWDEYFAYRIACSSREISQKDIIEFVSTSMAVEKDLLRIRKDYNTRDMNLNDFVIQFHKMTNFVLKKVAYIHGYLFALSDDLRCKITEVINENLSDSLLSEIWLDFGKSLNDLFVAFPTWENDQVFNNLIESIIKYYGMFEIHISQKDNGVYYDIPVRL